MENVSNKNQAIIDAEFTVISEETMPAKIADIQYMEPAPILPAPVALIPDNFYVIPAQAPAWMEKIPADVIFPEPIFKPNYTKDAIGNLIELDNAFSIVDRIKPKTVYAKHCTARYNLIRYEETIDLVAHSLDIAGIDFDLTVNMYDGGGIMQAVFTLPTVAEFIGLDDIVNLQFHLWRSINTFKKLMIQARALRLICLNGCIVGKLLDSFSHKHTQELVTDDILDVIASGQKAFKTESDIWASWKNHIVSPVEFQNIVTAIGIGKRHQENINNVVEISSGIRLHDTINGAGYKTLTMWELFNIFTQYFSHNVESMTQREKFNSGLTSAMEPYRLAA